MQELPIVGHPVTVQAGRSSQKSLMLPLLRSVG
jgi:hypothetical protein